MTAFIEVPCQVDPTSVNTLGRTRNQLLNVDHIVWVRPDPKAPTHGGVPSRTLIDTINMHGISVEMAYESVWEAILEAVRHGG